MTVSHYIILGVLAMLLFAASYWLLVVTEGVFLGSRMVIWLYDLTAYRYDGIKQFEPIFEEAYLARPLLMRLKSPAPQILDVATGTGRMAALLLDTPSFNGRVIGLDPSRKMLRFASPKLSPYRSRAALIRGTALELPFATATFDAVTCLEALEFFPADEPALQEMWRVLQPGGHLLTTLRVGLDARAFLKRHRTVSELESLLADIGFEEIRFQPWQVDYNQVYAVKPDCAGDGAAV